MKTAFFSIFIFAVVVFSTHSFAQNQLSEKPFDLVPRASFQGVASPESVLVDEPNGAIYVANVNGEMAAKNGLGYIAKLPSSGNAPAEPWVKGLNAPKGMGILDNVLYVADIDEVVRIDIASGTIIDRLKAPKATFLNDIAVDEKDKAVYVSNTFGFSGIYKVKNNQISLWLEGDALNMPNGLWVEGEQLLVAGWGKEMDPATFKTKVPGKIVSVSLKNKKITDASSPFGNLDGIAKTVHGYVVTDWLAGKLFYLKDGKTYPLLNLPTGAADLAFDKKTKTIYIPLMNSNLVVAYDILSLPNAH